MSVDNNLRRAMSKNFRVCFFAVNFPLRFKLGKLSIPAVAGILASVSDLAETVATALFVSFTSVSNCSAICIVRAKSMLILELGYF